DKDYQTAIARELLEETGYAFTSYEPLGKISANPSTNTNWMHMFLAKGGKRTSEQKLDSNEEIIVELYTIDEVKTMIREHKIIQSMHVTCILYALDKIGQLSY
ncbi:MAG TPA: NUDIX hydrolase, partial [Chitinophagaceae bacterium]|nr:NUDIX hydrolase [Chitinophagaceae bacterium]